MHSISIKSSESTTKSQQIVQELDTLESQSIGITKNDRSTSQLQTTSERKSNNSNMSLNRNNNMIPTQAYPSTTDSRNNTQLKHLKHHHSIQKARILSNKYAANYYLLDEPLTELSTALSAPSHHNNQSQLNKQ